MFLQNYFLIKIQIFGLSILSIIYYIQIMLDSNLLKVFLNSKSAQTERIVQKY